MNKFEMAVMALLGAIAIEGAYSAWEIRKIAREGFSMELSIEQADTLAQRVSEAKAAAAERKRKKEEKSGTTQNISIVNNGSGIAAWNIGELTVNMGDKK